VNSRATARPVPLRHLDGCPHGVFRIFTANLDPTIQQLPADSLTPKCLVNLGEPIQQFKLAVRASLFVTASMRS